MEKDAASKRLFALPVVVECLVRAVAPDLAGHLDFAGMQHLSANWSRPPGDDGSAGAQRYGDAVWRIPYAGDDGRTLLLVLEFQSDVAADMTERALDYTTRLIDHLRRQRRLDPDRKVRPLAVVVYSDSGRWWAEGGADAVPVSADGEPRLPVATPYRLLDSRRAPEHDSMPRNPALALLGIEASDSPEEAAARVKAMMSWLPEAIPDEEVRREFVAAAAEWVSVLMLRLFGIAAAELGDIGLGPFVEEKQMPSMERRVKQWEAGWFAQGEAQGMARGEERGMARGIAQGEARGIAEERELLRELAEIKFGAAVGEELARRLEPVSDTGKLREAGALIIRCDDGAELLARVRPNGDA